jgi:hypothetical protein
MDRVLRPPRHLLAALLPILFILGACASGGGSVPSSSPVASQPPSPTPAPSAAGGPVTTPEQAVAAVVAFEPRFAGIEVKNPDMIGQSAWYEVKQASGVGAFLVTMRIGWGDCPAGCIEQHLWTYAVAPDGGVTLQNETGSDAPADAWPGGGGGEGGGATGLQVTAVAGPVCPVERPGDPACAPKPVPGATILVMDASGKVLDKVTADAQGAAFIALDAGSYVIGAEGTSGMMAGPQLQPVTIQAGRISQVTLLYDTGIR